MFLRFYLALKGGGLPVSFREYLALLGAVRAGLAEMSADGFYHLARAALVKHERHLDRFDQIFAAHFRGMALIDDDLLAAVPAEWLRQLGQAPDITDEERALLQALQREGASAEELLARFRALLAEQEGRHEGGNKWIGTGGTSPFGNGGRAAQGLRIGEQAEGSGARRAIRAWDERAHRGLDGDLELNTRSLKMALRRLRILTREGAPDELDLPGTIAGTARNGGLLDLRLRPERRNRVKVLLLLDVGGSMEPHARMCSELFSAARHEFKHLAAYCFHNCVYDYVWQNGPLGRQTRTPTWQLLHTYNKDWRVVLVGDAAMSPYELGFAGPYAGRSLPGEGASGATWLRRLAAQYPALVWLNPDPEKSWGYTDTTVAIRRLVGGRMFPLTLNGLEKAMRELRAHAAP